VLPRRKLPRLVQDWRDGIRLERLRVAWKLLAPKTLRLRIGDALQ
jgi:hypothetical protein